jgi:hypothetical protein
MKWLLLAAAFGLSAAQAANDLLLLRDGGERRGNLQYCNTQHCLLDKAQVPQDSIAWIGLDGAKPPAPKPRNPAQNELHLRSGAVQPALLVSLDPQNIYTDRGMQPRKDVAWIHLVPAPLASGGAAAPHGSGAAESFPRAYVWDGRIEVENVYNGQNGRHRWHAEYDLRLLEHPRDYTRFYRDSLRGFIFEPQQLRYRISADQQYDRGAYAKRTVLMRGAASGAFTAAQLAEGRVVLGDIQELTAPARGGESTTHAFRTWQAYLEFAGRPTQPGAYQVNIGFINYRNDGPWSRVRNLYRGIDRSGTEPLAFENDPDHDFIHWVPASMPDGTNIFGRLATPDQGEVTGSLSYPVEGGVGSSEEPQRVSVRWSFRRTPR